MSPECSAILDPPKHGPENSLNAWTRKPPPTKHGPENQEITLHCPLWFLPVRGCSCNPPTRTRAWLSTQTQRFWRMFAAAVETQPGMATSIRKWLQCTSVFRYQPDIKQSVLLWHPFGRDSPTAACTLTFRHTCPPCRHHQMWPIPSAQWRMCWVAACSSCR